MKSGWSGGDEVADTPLGGLMRNIIPVLTVIAAILAFWMLAVMPMNAQLAADQAQRDGMVISPEVPAERAQMTGLAILLQNPGIIPQTYALERARLPSPVQVAQEMWKTTFEVRPTSRRSLVYQGWITVSATLLGFAIGLTLGIALAVGIVYSRTMDRSVMPWAIISQTIPILAIAPIIIVLLGNFGVRGIWPKSLIAAFLSFFPVIVGMVKGLRTPDPMQLDLLKTYGASARQGFWKLRLPSSAPYLFASMKIGISASLIGAIVAELPTGATAGFGARMLVGEQYNNMLVSWAALFAAGITAAVLVGIISLIERITLKRMGMAAA